MSSNPIRQSWYEASARARIAALVDPDSFAEFIGPEARETSPHLPIFDLPRQFDDGIAVGAATMDGTPVLVAADDVHTSHIHADDLARACVAALHRGRPQRTVNVADDSDLRMADYFDLVADRFGLPRPPRLARADAAAVLSPLQMRFLGESRRLVNRRMKAELGVTLCHPTVADGLDGTAARPGDGDNRGRRPTVRGDDT